MKHTKYIYCPSCRKLTIHERNVKLQAWICERCNPKLEEFE